MEDKIKEVLKQAINDISKEVASPVLLNLSAKKDDTSKLLDRRRKGNVHIITMEIMYVMKRARPDVEVAIGPKHYIGDEKILNSFYCHQAIAYSHAVVTH